MSLSTKPYIGSRDFYPDQMTFRNWMFGVQARVCRRYGYSEYAAPLIEPLDLYRAKSSDEIVSEQLYRFTDRGEREIAIRPELTPTLARMVAARVNELPRPLRWFSVGNFMRYERPGRGRLREFFQLNVDLLGPDNFTADAEVLMLAVDLMRAYGASPEQFEVRYSDRRLLEAYLSEYDTEQIRSISRIIDKRAKIKTSEFEEQLATACGGGAGVAKVEKLLALTTEDLAKAPADELDPEIAARISNFAEFLRAQGYGDGLVFDPGIVRGFDYYTGLIFEMYDRDPENNRALFGGGRYNRLVGMFGKQEIPAVGFGMGDVTLENFIVSHGLTPAELGDARGAYIALMTDELKGHVATLAGELRAAGIEVEIALEATKKFGKQFELAEKKGRRFMLILGDQELEQGVVRVKDLKSGEQRDISRADLARHLES
ncbi:MAG: histidine--tRNA ligase [Leptospirales bacterium]|jgi:histidyl-tRNA synthetase